MQYQELTDYLKIIQIIDRLKEAPYLPTPSYVIEEMLRMAKPKSGELLIDLGCGDGRILILAAKKYKCRCRGYEVDPRLVRLSLKKAKEEGVANLVEVIECDIFEAYISDADIITIYLSPTIMRRIKFKLETEAKEGARIVCHDYPIPGWNPVQIRELPTKGIHIHRLYLYYVM